MILKNKLWGRQYPKYNNNKYSYFSGNRLKTYELTKI